MQRKYEKHNRKTTTAAALQVLSQLSFPSFQVGGAFLCFLSQGAVESQSSILQRHERLQRSLSTSFHYSARYINLWFRLSHPHLFLLFLAPQSAFLTPFGFPRPPLLSYRLHLHYLPFFTVGVSRDICAKGHCVFMSTGLQAFFTHSYLSCILLGASFQALLPYLVSRGRIGQ